MPPNAAAPFLTRSQPLTTEALKPLQENVGPSILDFVREQQENTRYYAQEAALNGKQTKGSSIRAPRSPSSAQMHASSPPLIARVDLRKRNLESAVTNEQSKNPKQSSNLDDYTADQIIYGGVVRKKPETRPDKKKRGSVRSDEDEYSARLLERRERKRVKRDIMNPKRDESKENVSPIASPRRKKEDVEVKPKKKNKRGATASGIAIMETFTAANLKDSRLTLKPKSGGGLFKQAKSSVTVAVRGNGNKLDDSSTRHRKKHESVTAKKTKDQKKAPRDSTHKRDASWKRKHKAPLSSPDQTNSSSISESDCESKVNIKTRGKSPGSVNSSLNHSVNEAESDSWGIGSQLPSDTSSVRLPAAKSKGNSANTVDAQARPASIDILEPAITTMATQWNFDGNQGAFGIFDVVTPQPPFIDDDQSKIPNGKTATLLATNSRYFHLSNSPSPLANPGHSQQDSAIPRLREASPLQETTNSIPEYEDTFQGNMRDFGIESPDVLTFREYSPVNSLDYMLAAHDEDEAMYYMPEGNQFQDDYDQTGEEYLDVMMDEYAAEETMLGADEEEIGLVYNENYEAPFEAAQWNPLDDPNFGHQEEYEAMTAGLEDEGEPVDGYEFFEQEEFHKDGDKEQEEVDLRPYNEPDILPVAKGRLILMGMQEPDVEIRYSTHQANDTHALTYGQSVQDIEIAFGSQIGHHW